jgi:hypothetical protein
MTHLKLVPASDSSQRTQAEKLLDLQRGDPTGAIVLRCVFMKPYLWVVTKKDSAQNV